MEATIGNNNELSCEEPSSIFLTELETEPTLFSISPLAFSNVESNQDATDFTFFNSVVASRRTSLRSNICSEIVPISVL